MDKSLIREWKKVFKTDLSYIVYELKELVKAPAMIILEGEVGAGKTTFTQAFLDNGQTLSPTYSILSETGNVLHADLYRIEKSEDIIPLELSVYLEGKQFFLVEWGLKYARRLIREIPENFNLYLLEIQINEGQQESLSRNFVLSSLKED